MELMNFRKLLILLMAVLLLAAGTSIRASKIPADQVKVTTPVYKPDFSEFKPPLGKYEYSVSWNGIPAGSVDLELALNGSEYKITSNARSASGIDLVYRLRYHSESIVSAKTFRPLFSKYVSRENSRRKITELQFLPSGEISYMREDHHGKVERLRFQSDNFTLDPYSAAFLAISLKWEVGDKRLFDTFTGKSRYLIELTAVERTKIEVNGRTRDAFVIIPNVTKLTDTESPKKLREAKIYVSADNSHEILKVVSDLFIGSVQTIMESFTPSVSSAAPAGLPG